MAAHEPTDGMRKASIASSRRRSIVATKKGKKNVIDKDDWDAVIPEMDTGPAWSELSGGEKVKRVVIGTAKICGVFIFLYFFICSLTLLSASFKLLAGKNTSALMNNKFILNPVVGLIVGILLTVLVQSSSTSTSIIVSMVSAGMLSVKAAIPIIMGSNVGTSVTNTLVSLTQAGDRAIFRRAFAGGTVHDMFNWLTVIVLLVIEVIFHMLYKLTSAVVKSLLGGKGGSVAILTVITDPFTNLIVQLDEQVMNCWSLQRWDEVKSILKRYCKFVPYNPITTLPSNMSTISPTSTHSYSLSTMNHTATPNYTTTWGPAHYDCPADHSIRYDNDDIPSQGVPDTCTYLFQYTGINDAGIGAILLVLSLAILAGSLIGIVKVLSSMLKGSIAGIINKTLNANIPYVPWLTGYVAILVGAVMTFIIQSSSIFTSTLTPLIGLGVLSVERAFPLMLGSNIGTTTTAILAALASPPRGLEHAVQIALVHLFFNVIGICIWYPIPFMRVPIVLCKILGNTTAEYRWFAIVYLIGMFFVFPILIFALDMISDIALFCVLGPFIVIIIFAIVVNIMQDRCPRFLPSFLKDWSFLPEPLRSLDPYDRLFMSMACCKRFHTPDDEEDDLEEVVSAPGSRKASEKPVLSIENGKKHSRKSSSSSSSSSSHSVHSRKKEGIDNEAMVYDEEKEHKY